MMIRCDFVDCTVECRFWGVCDLHHPSNFSLIRLESELNWSVNRLSEINDGINHFRTTLLQLKHNQLSSFIKEHISEKQIQTELEKLQKEKHELLSKIREYQTREKNIKKILKRRT